MDPFDEFQFKPLTEGLGFNKKTKPLTEMVKSAGLAEDHLQTLPSQPPEPEKIRSKPIGFDDVIKSLEKAPFKPSITDKTFLDVTEPLPRARASEPVKAMEVEMPRPIQSPFPSPDVLRKPYTPTKPIEPAKVPIERVTREKVGTRRGAADSPRIMALVPTAVSFSAMALDTIMVVALNLIFLVMLVSVTKVDLGHMIRGAQTEALTRFSLIFLLLSIVQMYVIVSRAFFGRTLGEWTFDIQLGTEAEQKTAMYPVLVVFRAFVTLATGMIVLPIFSLAMDSDLAGEWTGIKLYKQQ